MQPSEYKCFDWHEPLWRELLAPDVGLPHALLLTGPEGIGKSVFAHAIAARLLCENPLDGGACGTCPSCRWLGGGNHPDFRHVIPEADAEVEGEAVEGEKKKASRQIRIDQIRALEDFVFIGGHRSGARVVIIDPAEAMNIPAANSLLKILEEPPASVYFILVSSQWRRLLPTIRSRCRVLKLPRPSPALARQWLAARGRAEAAKLLPLLGEAPLLALEEDERGRGAVLLALLASLREPGRDPLALAARWLGQLQPKSGTGVPMEGFVRLLQTWVFDLAMCGNTGRSRFAEGGKTAGEIGALIRCYNDLMKFRSLASHPLNPQLFLEDIAERYLRALAGAGR